MSEQTRNTSRSEQLATELEREWGQEDYLPSQRWARLRESIKRDAEALDKQKRDMASLRGELEMEKGRKRLAEDQRDEKDREIRAMQVERDATTVYGSQLLGQLDEAEDQRDRLAEALRVIQETGTGVSITMDAHYRCGSCVRIACEALASLNKKESQ